MSGSGVQRRESLVCCFNVMRDTVMRERRLVRATVGICAAAASGCGRKCVKLSDCGCPHHTGALSTSAG